MEPALFLLLGKPSELVGLPLLPLFFFFLLPGVEAGPFPLAAGEAKRLPLPPLLDAREANNLAWAVTAPGAKPTPLPSEEATASTWRAERRGGGVLVSLALGVVFPALGVETGVGPPRRSGGRAARFGRLATAVAAGDPFRALSFGRAFAGAFVAVLLLGMLIDVAREDGRSAEELEKMDRAQKGDDRHDGDDSGRGGGEYLRRYNEDCVDVRRIPST